MDKLNNVSLEPQIKRQRFSLQNTFAFSLSSDQLLFLFYINETFKFIFIIKLFKALSMPKFLNTHYYKLLFYTPLILIGWFRHKKIFEFQIPQLCGCFLANG